MATRQSDRKQFTWANGSSNSPTLKTDGFITFGVYFPASFEPTTIKFQSFNDDANVWVDIYDKTGTLVTITSGASRAQDLPGELADYPVFRMVQTAGGAPAADRSCVLSMRN